MKNYCIKKIDMEFVKKHLEQKGGLDVTYSYWHAVTTASYLIDLFSVHPETSTC